ncbi:MAG: hypothetical protein AVDCRST_MAG07-1207, partial [uncultured Frankineae bacterium]
GQRSDPPSHRRCVARRPGAHGAAVARHRERGQHGRPLLRRDAGPVAPQCRPAGTGGRRPAGPRPGTARAAGPHPGGPPATGPRRAGAAGGGDAGRRRRRPGVAARPAPGRRPPARRRARLAPTFPLRRGAGAAAGAGAGAAAGRDGPGSAPPPRGGGRGARGGAGAGRRAAAARGGRLRPGERPRGAGPRTCCPCACCSCSCGRWRAAGSRRPDARPGRAGGTVAARAGAGPDLRHCRPHAPPRAHAARVRAGRPRGAGLGGARARPRRPLGGARPHPRPPRGGRL